MQKRSLTVGLAAVAAACAPELPTGHDNRDESIFSGEGDSVEEGSAEALGILRAANTLDYETFVEAPPEGVGLAADAAEGIVAYREGDSGDAADERLFETLAELDAVDFVGPEAVDKLLDYAHAHDLVPACELEGAPAGDACHPAEDECASDCRPEPTALRVTSLELREPNPFTRVVFVCRNITGDVNDQAREAIEEDGTGDGYLDLSALTAFRPLDPDAESTGLDVLLGQCAPPPSDTACEPDPEAPRVETTARNQTEGSCLGVLPDTTGPAPAVAEPGAPCFASDPETLTVPFGDFEVTLSGARVAATYDGHAGGADPDALTSGLIRGFISEDDADDLVLPDDVPFVGGDRLSELLPGGDGNCADHDDRTRGPDGDKGWYFYLNFEAETVPFSEAGGGA